MNTTDTPRTFARLKALHEEGAYTDPTAVDVDFACQLERELADLYEGRCVVLPKTAKHAKHLILVAEACLKNNNL